MAKDTFPVAVPDPQSTVGIPTHTRKRAAVKAGAATGAALGLVMIMVPAVIGALTSPFLAGWLPMIFLFALPWIAVSGMIGAVSGRLVSKANQSFIGAAVGTALSLIVAGIYVGLSISSREPPDNFIGPLVYAALIGSTSGTVAVVAARSNASTLKYLRFTLRDVIPLAVPLLITTAWYGHQIHASHLRSIIHRAGGSVTWNAIENPKGNWVVDFHGKQFDDSALQALLPTLSAFRRLDLDLGQDTLRSRIPESLPSPRCRTWPASDSITPLFQTHKSPS